ncbi:hypothetical protein HDU97_001650 [Phlyctochytrium planicorne]|nr:hypothetical protein HDU97_001650 [Phlyctochytrium planicorne]
MTKPHTATPIDHQERHHQKNGGDVRGPLKKGGAGKHNWGTAEDDEEMVLEERFEDGQVHAMHDAQQATHVNVVGSEEFERLKKKA